MAEEEIAVIELQDRFYRDSIGKLAIAYACISFAIAIIIGIVIYLYFDKPPPVVFPVDNEMRVQPPVALTQPYLSDSDLIQWVAEVIPKVFILDFINYETQLAKVKTYFTENGWNAFSNQLNIYANYNTVQANKLFLTAQLTEAPQELNNGIIVEVGKYGWWVQVPLLIKYDGFQPIAEKNVIFQVLVVRVSTLNNLMGIAIDNILQAPDKAQGR